MNINNKVIKASAMIMMQLAYFEVKLLYSPTIDSTTNKKSLGKV